ncbi:STAS domain-containing protein [Streptomyces lavendofoliae]|uniref:STAS domain-containing protein n=1 Tax=Streptomyces lavendofoliae TaxID=67314 RepID=UPI003D8F442C
MPDHRDDSPPTPDTFTVHTETLPDQAVLLTLSGSLDHHTSPHLTDHLDTLPPTALQTVLLDLSALSFIDSTGLTTLLQIRRAAADAGGTVDLIAPSPPVQQMLNITGVDQIFDIHPDLHARPTRTPHRDG